jgi:GT2 family glycosyltransferase
MNDRSNSFLTLDALIICYNRQIEVDLAIESCNLEGIQTVYVLDNASNIPIVVKPEVSLIRSDKNLGPCNGRNALALTSTADLLLFLDDDAELSPNTDISRLIKEFESDPNLAIMASLATRGDGQIARHEFPARKVHKIDVPRDVGYFVGCGFIIRNSVLKNLKGFDGNFFYWHEETDMSLRVAAASGRIVYNPAFQVTHRPSVRGRDLTAKNYSRQMRNRKILAWRSLPPPISYLHLAIWFAYYLLNSSPTGFFSLTKSAFSPITKEEKTIGRLPLPYRKLNQLQRIGYRIYW